MSEQIVTPNRKPAEHKITKVFCGDVYVLGGKKLWGEDPDTICIGIAVVTGPRPMAELIYSDNTHLTLIPGDSQVFWFEHEPMPERLIEVPQLAMTEEGLPIAG